MKYKEELIEKVRKGETQIQVDNESKWNDLLKYIFPKKEPIGLLIANYYIGNKDSQKGYDWSSSYYMGIPIIHAKDFIIQEPEVNWVEVRDYEEQWKKRILLADLGERFKYRYIVVNPEYNDAYIKGGDSLLFGHYKFMRPVPQPEPLTHKQIEELIGKPFKYVEE